MRARKLAAASLLLVGSAVVAGESPPVPRNAVRLQDVPLTIGTPGEIPTRIPEVSSGGREIKIRVNRIWKTGPKTHAAVRLQNTATVDYNDVSVTCTAVDKEDRPIGTQKDDLRRTGVGVFRSGSIVNLDLVFDTPNAEVRALTCDARARGLPRLID